MYRIFGEKPKRGNLLKHYKSLDSVKFVGLKGYSRYSDKKSLTLDEINSLKDVAVALNRVKGGEELIKICRKIRHEHVILNELYAIANVSKFKKVTVSVGMNAMNNLDLRFYKELGAHAVVIPPELNYEVESFEKEDLKIEVFGRVFVEMFYKGKCQLSIYASGKSVKKDGVCNMECAVKWDVIYSGQKVCETSFKPELRFYDVEADYIKHETRQINGEGVIDSGIDNQHSQS